MRLERGGRGFGASKRAHQSQLSCLGVLLMSYLAIYFFSVRQFRRVLDMSILASGIPGKKSEAASGRETGSAHSLCALG